MHLEDHPCDRTDADCDHRTAQTFPSKPVKVVVAFGPGVVDTGARLIAQRLSEKWGQPVVVENRTGAGGNIAAEAAARSAGDGTIFLVTARNIVVNVALFERVPYRMTRIEKLPNVPTVRESGLADFETGAWLSLWAPGGTAPAIVQQVNRDIRGILESRETREQMSKLGMEVPAPMSPEQLGTYMMAEMKKWGEVVRASGAKVN